jgi:hypothetical protein
MDKEKKETKWIMIDYPPRPIEDNSAGRSPGDDIQGGQGARIFIETSGNEDTKAVMVPEEIRCHIKFDQNPSPYISFQYIAGFVSALVTEDPTKVHYDIVRATIKEIDQELLHDKGAIDIMARELIEHCRKLDVKYKEIKQFQPLLNREPADDEILPPDSGRAPLYLNITLVDKQAELEMPVEDDGMFVWDKKLLEVIKNTGKLGKAKSIEYRDVFRRRLTMFKVEGKTPLSFWFNLDAAPGAPFHISSALLVLSNCIYEDIVKKTISYRDKYPPLLPKTIQHSVNIIHKGKVKRSEDHIQMFDEGNLVGESPIAMIDQRLLSHVLRGVDKFRTVTGHRLLRFLPLQAHNQFTNGINPCNILEYSGGFAQIADELGLNGKNYNTDIKDLLHALAFMDWQFPDFTGNFIVLGQYKQEVTRNQNPGVKVTLGPEFSPYYAAKHRELLIPILKDPQLVGTTSYHAHQFRLQDAIIAEASRQSVTIAEEGFFTLTNPIWEQSGLPKKILENVKECWIRDGDSGERFLDKIGKDTYTLGPTYHKELTFLKEQGERRLKRSREALIAIEKRKSKTR